MINIPKHLPKFCELIEGKTRVRKTINYGVRESIFNFMESIVQHLINNPHSHIVPVYQFHAIERNVAYAYDMQALGTISIDERALINHYRDLQDRFGIGACEMSEEEFKLEPKFPQLTLFLKKIIRWGYYHDLHAGNVMLDEHKQYRIIDLEGFYDGNYLAQANGFDPSIFSSLDQ